MADSGFGGNSATPLGGARLTFQNINSPFGSGLGTPTSMSGWRTPGTLGGSLFSSPAFLNNVMAASTPMSSFSMKSKKQTGSEGRYIVYYDEDDVEIFRKAKGPGRLPRGAFVDRDGNYGVKVRCSLPFIAWQYLISDHSCILKK
jgi:hypothetical protein